MDSLGNISRVSNFNGAIVSDRNHQSVKAEETGKTVADQVSLTGKTAISDSAYLIKPDLSIENGSTNISETNAITSQKNNIYGTINGWVGKNSANLTINQIGDNVNADGWVGSASVHINERKFGGGSAISGNIHTHSEGFKSVNINVSGPENMRTLNGWIGKDNVWLTEREGFQGESEITGRIGSKDIDVRFGNRNGNIVVNGDVRDSMAFGSERVLLSGHQNPSDPNLSTLCIIPALTIISK